MTVLPSEFIDADDDWIERLRRWLWPKLKPLWSYSTIEIQDDEYVTTVGIPEEVLEVELHNVGFVRNPVAGLKQHEDGERTSQGSWCLLPQNDPTGRLDEDEQLHITLFDPPNQRGRELFAHVDTDWRDDPEGHLTDGTQIQRGRSILLEVLREHTYLDLAVSQRGDGEIADSRRESGDLQNVNE